MPQPSGLRRLAIFGAGGFGREVLQIVIDIERRTPGRWLPVCFIVDPGYASDAVAPRLPVLSDLDALRASDDIDVVIAVGNPAVRRSVAARLHWLPDERHAVLVHPSAYVAAPGALGAGTIVCANASITTDVTVGRHAQIHAGARIGHDAVIGDCVSVFPGAIVAGHVAIGAGTELGSGSVVLPKLRVGCDSVVGAGAVVIRSLLDCVTAVGNPARVIKRR